MAFGLSFFVCLFIVYNLGYQHGKLWQRDFDEKTRLGLHPSEMFIDT